MKLISNLHFLNRNYNTEYDTSTKNDVESSDESAMDYFSTDIFGSEETVSLTRIKKKLF